MSLTETDKLGDPESAGEWHDRLMSDSLSEEERRQFVRWIKQSPNHVEEYLRVSSIYAQLKDALANETLH